MAAITATSVTAQSQTTFQRGNSSIANGLPEGGHTHPVCPGRGPQHQSAVNQSPVINRSQAPNRLAE